MKLIKKSSNTPYFLEFIYKATNIKIVDILNPAADIGYCVFMLYTSYKIYIKNILEIPAENKNRFFIFFPKIENPKIKPSTNNVKISLLFLTIDKKIGFIIVNKYPMLIKNIKNKDISKRSLDLNFIDCSIFFID